MAKTKKEFLENYSGNSELAKKVLRQMTSSWTEIKAYPEDFQDAGAGIGGFIYYIDTVAFAKRNLVFIMDALNEFENETGSPLNKPTEDECTFYNWLAWFALETIISEIVNYLED